MNLTPVSHLIRELKILDCSNETFAAVERELDQRIKTAWKTLTNKDCTQVNEATSLNYIAGNFSSDAEEDSCSDSFESLTLEDLVVSEKPSEVRVAK